MNSKKVLDSFYYSFDASAKTITFMQELGIQQSDILLITNMTKNNTLIYNFACKTEGGTLTSNILSLIYNTNTMSNNDQLMVIVTAPDKSELYLKEIKDSIKETNELLITFLEIQNK